MKREIEVPKILHEIHGEKTTLLNFILTYLVGISIGLIVILSLRNNELPIWKIILVFIVYIDVAGGVISNLSSSTNQYYQKRKILNLLFPILHVIQPLIMLFVFPKDYKYLIFIAVYTISFSYILKLLRKAEDQQSIASVAVIFGTVISLLIPVQIQVIYSFGLLFMIKIVLGFSVRRPVL